MSDKFLVKLSKKEVERIINALGVQLINGDGLGHMCHMQAAGSPHYNMEIVHHNKLAQKLSTAAGIKHEAFNHRTKE